MTCNYSMHELCQQLQAIAMNYGYNARALRQVKQHDLLPAEREVIHHFEEGSDDTDDCFRLQDIVCRLSVQACIDERRADSFAGRRLLNHHRIERFFTTTQEQ